MTEKSYYWESTITGDASLALYEDFIYANIWQKLFTRKDNHGVIDDILNELSVTGVTGGVQIDTGAAIVNGWFYENDTKITKVIDTPSSNPRIDAITARMIFSDQSVNITVIEGTEAATPEAPAITQSNNVLWDIPLAYIQIDTDGTITVTDAREFCQTPLAEQQSMILIEEIEVETTGLGIEFVFDNIPQNYSNLMILGQWRGSSSTGIVRVELNDDTNIEVGGNYWRQTLNSDGGSNVVVAINTSIFVFVDEAGLGVNEGISFRFCIPNYNSSVLYKNVIQDEVVMGALGAVQGQPLASEALSWLNTDPIEKIRLTDPTGTILAGSKMTLYGL